MVRFRIFLQNRDYRLLLPSLCALMLLSGWPGTSAAEPLRRIDQIKAALAAPKAQDMRAFAGQAPRRGLLHHPPSAHAFPPGLPLAMPSFSTAYVRDGFSFPLTVIGLDPARGLTTTIPTVIFAYRLQLADGTVFDASSDVIDGVTPVQGVLASPIFKPAHWTAGGVSHGTTQWSDVVMRANFAGRMAVGYHVLLGTPTVIPITVDVPAAFGTSVVDPQAGVREAFIDAEWLSNLIIQVTQSHGVAPTTLPIHLFSQVAAAFADEFSFGFHNAYAFTTPSGTTLAAPFIQAGYFSKAVVDPAGRSQAANTGVLAHELAEWLMDPATKNFTVPWQDPAHPGVCTNPLVEIADPLDVIAPGVDVAGYRFPDVALLPWFTGGDVLRSVDHQYSLFGTLTSRSSVCPNFVNFQGVAIGITGADTTVFTGVNNQHQVVGFFTVGGGVGSFMLSNVDPIAGTATTFSSVLVPGSFDTFALNVNDAGNVVGVYFDSQLREHGFLLQGSAYVSIDFPGAVATEALATNNHGDIVGDYTDSAGVVHGFALMNWRFQAVDAPFASALSVTGINDSRMVVGTYSQGATTASFIGPLGHLQPFSFPQISPLDVVNFPATFQTFASGLNNSQEIVGNVRINGAPPVAFAATEGLFQPVSPAIDFDGAQTSQANSVNNSGAVVGSFTDHNGTFGFLLLPGTNFGLPFQRVMIAAP